MKKMKKARSKILSLLLTAAMVFSMLPTAAFAEATEDVPGPRAAGDIVYVHADKSTGTANGSFDKPYKTLAEAYAAVTTGGEIRVLSDLTATAPTNITGKSVTIQSYDEASGATPIEDAGRWTLTRGFSAEGRELGSIFFVTAGSLTLKNIIVDGDLTKYPANPGNCFIYIMGANTDTKVHLESGSVLQNGGMTSSGAAVLVGFNTGFGTLYVHDGALITRIDNSGSTIRSNIIESAYGNVHLLGGEISGNTLANIPAAGAVLMMANGNLYVSGNPKVTDNKTTAGELANVYLNGRTITVNGALTSGANIGVALATMPDNTTKTKDIAIKGSYNITDTDVQYFHSDKATAAGVRLAGTSGDATAKVVLDYDTRVIVSTDVTFDNDGKANISINPTTVGTHYAILDKDGAVVTTAVGVTGGTNVDTTNWYTANNSGAMTFGGIDPANGPYQVVTSTDSTTAPDGNSGATANTIAGDKVQFLYVKSDGSDTNAGIKSAPFQTVKHAFTKAAANTTVVIILLSDLETPFDNNTSSIPQAAGGTTIITSEGGPWTMYRDCTTSTSATLSVSSTGAKIKLVLDNVILNGASDNTSVSKTVFGEVFIATGGEVVLRNHAKITNSATRAVNIHEGGIFTMEGGEISGNKAGANTMWGGDNYQGIANAGGGVYACPGGTFIMTGGTITKNTATAGAAGVFGEKGAIFKMSGSPKVFGNLKDAESSNVYLKDGQTITLTGRMADGAEVHVYVDPMPNATDKTAVIATAAQQADAKYFHSDKMTEAGVVYKDTQIVLSYDARAQATGKVDKDGKGQMIVVVQNNTKYQVTEKGSNTVPSGLTATDKDGATVTPDANGWYQTNKGPLVFKPLELAKEYEVHSSTDATPGAPTPGGGTTVKIPVVGDNVYAKPEENNKVTIVIDPADPKLKYAVLDPNGDKVMIDGADLNGWVTGKGDKIVVELPGLPAGKEYTIVGVPFGDTTSTPETSTDGGGKVTVPAEGLKEVNGDNISRVPSTPAGKDKIVLNPTSADQEYGVRDPITGDIIWQQGTGAGGADVVFDELDPNKDYDVVTRTPGSTNPDKEPSMPTQGVTVPKNLAIGSVSGNVETNDTATTDDDATITINPTDTTLDYGIVDKNGDPVTGFDNWKPGTDGSVSFPGLKPGDGYIIVTKPHSAVSPAAPADANGGLPVIAPVAPTGKPNKDGTSSGTTSATREPNAGAATDKITIPAVEATTEYKFAIKDKDGKYYDENGAPSNTPVYITGTGADIVFD